MASELKAKGIEDIVSRVREILLNTGKLQSFHIVVDGAAGEATSIKYTIEELIVPKEDGGNE